MNVGQNDTGPMAGRIVPGDGYAVTDGFVRRLDQLAGRARPAAYEQGT